jgi:hypothetical protein
MCVPLRARGRVVGVLAVAIVFSPLLAEAARFNFDTGNAPLRVVTPPLVRAIRQVSPGANDASIVLRIVTLVDNAAFDAIAPYHPTAVGVYSRLGRRPPAEGATNRNKNVAILYAVHKVLNSLLPQNAQDWRGMLQSVGLDPDNQSTDTTTAVGIGNVAGAAVVAAREHDGMNQLGDEGGRKYHRRPYADYTGYEPVNTAYELVDAGRWQPRMGTAGGGMFNVQSGVTPQWALTRPYSYDDPAMLPTPVPDKSNPYLNPDGYKQQADEVLAASAGLTDRQKMMAELFDDKVLSLGGAAVFVTKLRRLTLDEFVQMDFVGHMAAFDAGIACWKDKYRHDAVRPFSAIRYLYGDDPVTAWGGPGKGTVSDMPASQWRSYMNTADHPEYPSGSACFCAAFSQAQRRYFGTDNLGYFVPYPKGSSKVEPGVTPSRFTVLGPWPTWTDMEEDCATSRVHGGVHFRSAVEEGREQCRPVGDLAYEFLKKHIDGTAP